MKSLIGSFLALGLASMVFTGCTGDDAVPLKPIVVADSGVVVDSGKADTGVVADSGVATDSGTADPAPPALGVQIDRFGRPAINTALNGTFDKDVLPADAAAVVAKKNAYNANKNAAAWGAAYKSEIAKNLAILDAIDGTCGNQFGAKTALVADRYDTLAGALADDRMWVNTAGTACTQYLAVEVSALGVPGLGTDCGGRKLGYDVIETTYSALAAGVFVGVDDTIAAVPGKTNGATFPYLAAPLAP